MNRWEGATEASMDGGTLPKLINPDLFKVSSRVKNYNFLIMIK